MYGELASVKGIVDLSQREALDEAASFLEGLGYSVVGRTDASLTAKRETATGAGMLTVAALIEPTGGVHVKVRGNDREGVEAAQDAWRDWSEGLPKRSPAEQVPPPPSYAPPVGSASGGNTAAVVGCSVVALVLIVGLAGCAALFGAASNFEKSTPGTPPAPSSSSSAAGPIVVRISGTSGLAYSGSYGSGGSGTRSVEGKVGGGQDRYEVPVQGGFDVVTAVFQKRDAQGTLEVQITDNGRTVERQETSAQYGVVSVNYNP